MKQIVREEPVTKPELIERITAKLHECNDIPLLDLIDKLLLKSI